MDYNELLSASVQVGYGLLLNGGEVSRVEESIRRILAAYGIVSPEVFAIPSLILVSIEDGEGRPVSKIKRVTQTDINLDRMERYNDLCRRICRDRPPLSDIGREAAAIDQSRAFSPALQVAAGALIALSFTLFYGGTPVDSLVAALCGTLLKLVHNGIRRFGTNAFFVNIAASFFPSLLALLAVKAGFGASSDKIIIGTLMNLVPGVIITSFMRDIIAGDLVSGLNKLTESLLIATAIALGAGMAISAVGLLWGVMG